MRRQSQVASCQGLFVETQTPHALRFKCPLSLNHFPLSDHCSLFTDNWTLTRNMFFLLTLTLVP